MCKGIRITNKPTPAAKPGRKEGNMRFDRTDGKKARYMVSIYRGMVNDQIYYHYYKQAKACFDGIKNGGAETGNIISVYDLSKDTRKDFARL